MNVVIIKNGIGNQMFQYAFYKKLKLLGQDVRADISWFEKPGADRSFSLRDAFPELELDTRGAAEELRRMDERIADRSFLRKAYETVFPKQRIHISDSKHKRFDPAYLTMENRCFDGFWQTEKYWLEEKETIRDCFRFREIPNDRLRQLEELCAGENTVSLHIRRGDYLLQHRRKRFANVCTEEYYHRAVAYIRERVPNARFVVFSDDIAYVRANKQEDWMIAQDYLDEGIPDWMEMKLMSLCSHQIIANSTFSWWGAYLNRNPEKIVITPKVWFKDVKELDIWPEGWVRL